MTRPPGIQLLSQSPASVVSKRAHPTHAAGVTLIELMLTVAISITLATMAGSELRRIQIRTRERAATQEVAALLQAARMQARSHRAPVTVTVREGRIELSDTIDGTVSHAIPSDLYKVTLGATDSLVFNAQGGLSVSQPVSVSMVSRSGTPRILQIYPAIGAIRDQ